MSGDAPMNGAVCASRYKVARPSTCRVRKARGFPRCSSQPALWAAAAPGQSAGEQAQAEGDLMRMQTRAEQMVEVVAIREVLTDLLDAPPLPVDAGVRAEGEQAQAVTPGTAAQANGSAGAQPAPLLRPQSGQPLVDRRRAGKAQVEGHRARQQGNKGGATGEATVADRARRVRAGPAAP